MKKFIFSFLFILFPLLSFASERILDLNVTLFIRDDLRADVIEEITVVAEHKNIRRGIVREIPSQSGHRQKHWSFAPTSPTTAALRKRAAERPPAAR